MNNITVKINQKTKGIWQIKQGDIKSNFWYDYEEKDGTWILVTSEETYYRNRRLVLWIII